MNEQGVGLAGNGRNMGLFLFVLLLPILAGACRKAASEAEVRGTRRPAAEAIAEADQLYTGRSDLTKVRQALVALRQSQADDPTNYELAWRVAEFYFYLCGNSSEYPGKKKTFSPRITGPQ